ncbi:MAG: cytosolic Fe-S cluster assembly factor cfd1 [Sclerophora amabilis]|nr:MAG: cytosolic Fe-S cluster assembly factor cfd1 [Sclerophora amabilis]
MSLSQVKHIVLVLSGKGGVGKSSITTQLALSLSLAGKTVGVLDIDLTGPSIPRFFGLEEGGKVTQSPTGWIPVTVHPTYTIPNRSRSTSAAPQTDGGDHDPRLQHISSAATSTASPTNDGNGAADVQVVGSLHCMSLGFLLPSRNDAVVWRGPKKTAMVRQFLKDVRWGPLDYLLVDTPPGTSDEHIALAESLITDLAASTQPPGGGGGGRPRQLAGAVVVTTPQAISTADVRKELNFCAKTGIRVLGVIENMAGYVCPCCGEVTNVFSKGGGEVMARDVRVPFLGAVPLDAQFVRLVEEGKRPDYAGEGMGQSGEAARERAEADVSTGRGRQTGTDEPRLIEKYTSCSLCPILGEIARKIYEQVELDPGH